MIYLYLGLVIGISIFEIMGLKKKGQPKDILFFIVSMALVAVFGSIYLLDNYQPSIVSYLLELLNVKG